MHLRLSACGVPQWFIVPKMPQANEPIPIERTLEPAMRDTTIETLGGGSEPVRAGEWIYSTASQRFAVADEIVRDLFRLEKGMGIPQHPLTMSRAFDCFMLLGYLAEAGLEPPELGASEITRWMHYCIGIQTQTSAPETPLTCPELLRALRVLSEPPWDMFEPAIQVLPPEERARMLTELLPLQIDVPPTVQRRALCGQLADLLEHMVIEPAPGVTLDALLAWHQLREFLMLNYMRVGGQLLRHDLINVTREGGQLLRNLRLTPARRSPVTSTTLRQEMLELTQPGGPFEEP